ncbi:unnamed protein product, partial [Symbiodinium sp. KB8]
QHTYRYFTFDYHNKDVTLEYNLLSGTIEVYVTNMYRRGMAPEWLPNRGNVDPCMWTFFNPASTHGHFELKMTDPCNDESENHSQTYTVGVLGTSEQPAEFELTMYFDGDVPYFDEFVAKDKMQYYSFEVTPNQFSAKKNVAVLVNVQQQLAEANSDVFLTLTTDSTPPTCTINQGKVQCDGMWQTPDAGHAGRLLVNGSSPCGAPYGTTNCKFGSYHSGTWILGVYGIMDATFDLLIKVGEEHIT